jgi:hypothetical protein
VTLLGSTFAPLKLPTLVLKPLMLLEVRIKLPVEARVEMRWFIGSVDLGLGVNIPPQGSSPVGSGLLVLGSLSAGTFAHGIFWMLVSFGCTVFFPGTTLLPLFKGVISTSFGFLEPGSEPLILPSLSEIPLLVGTPPLGSQGLVVLVGCNCFLLCLFCLQKTQVVLG